jgi:hypothetical protein
MFLLFHELHYSASSVSYLLGTPEPNSPPGQVLLQSGYLDRNKLGSSQTRVTRALASVNKFL